MNGFVLVAGLIGAFFVIGFASGALLAIVVPASRRRRAAGRRPPLPTQHTKSWYDWYG